MASTKVQHQEDKLGLEQELSKEQQETGGTPPEQLASSSTQVPLADCHQQQQLQQESPHENSSGVKADGSSRLSLAGVAAAAAVGALAGGAVAGPLGVAAGELFTRQLLRRLCLSVCSMCDAAYMFH
jgi:hypothetical protein